MAVAETSIDFLFLMEAIVRYIVSPSTCLLFKSPANIVDLLNPFVRAIFAQIVLVVQIMHVARDM